MVDKKKLRLGWSKKEKDIMIHYPSRQDGHMMDLFLHHTKLLGNGKTFREELEARGYDITTIKFSIERKAQVYDEYRPRLTGADAEAARNDPNKPTGACCNNEQRGMNGGCGNCGTPCL